MSTQEHKAKFTADTKDFEKGADRVANKGNWLTGKIKALGGAMAGFFAFGTILQGIKSVIKANVEFEKSLANLSAITGAVGDDLKYYGEQARKIGKETTYGANEAVEAFKLMGSARPELLKNKEALAAVTREALVLAEASGLDLTTATYSLAKAMNQFNVPANEAARVINVLAAGSKYGAEEVPGVAEAIKTMGTAAYMANVSLEQSVGMIETLAEKGLTGAESGTQLRNVILKLQSETDKWNPKIVGMSKALENLADANLSAADLTKMFGLRNQQAAAILIENRGVLNDYTKAVTGTNTAYEQQAVLLDTVDAKWKIFKDTLADITIAGYNFTDSLKVSLGAMTDFIQGLQEVSDSENLKWWQKLAITFNQLLPGGVKLTKEEIDALTISQDKSGKSAEELAAAEEEEAAALEKARLEAEAKAKAEAAAALAKSKTIGGMRIEIDNLVASLEDLSTEDGKRAEEIRNTIALYERLIDEILNYRTVIATPDIGPSAAPEAGGLLGPSADEIEELQKAGAAIDEELSNIELAYTSAQLAAAQFGTEVMASSIEGARGLKEFASVAVSTAKRIISAYLAEGVAVAVKKALTDVPFPFNIVAAGIAGGAAAALFNSIVPNFAAGGAVSGPTMALVGEAPGISASNPEYIGTAKQLAQMGIGGGNLTCRVSRGDLLFILNEGKSVNMGSY